MLKQVHLRFFPVSACAIFFLFTAFLPTKVWGRPLPAVSVLLQVNRASGSATGVASFSGDGESALLGTLSQPEGVSIDGAGNLYIADTSNNRVRRIDAKSGVIITVAGNGTQGYSGDGSLAVNAALNQPAAVLADFHGNLYIADTGNRIIRFVNIETGIITTVVGTPNVLTFDPTHIGDGGPASSAQLDTPAALALDTAGDLYIADSGDNRIRMVTALTGTITTVAGNGAAAYAGDSALATSASLDQPTSIGLDAANNIYIADSGNNVIRKVTSSNGDITTIAGVNGATTFNGDGPGISTNLNFPTGLAVDMAGQVYFSDRLNNRIRKLNASGNVVTLGGNGTARLAGDGQLAINAEFSAPGGLARDAAGDLYVADSMNNEIRLLSTGLGFPAAEIATSTSVTHTIFLQVNLAATLTAPLIAAAENSKQEFQLGTISGCTMDDTAVNAAGSVCSLPVTFNPAYPGTRTAPMELAANNATVVSLGLYGVGLGPQAVLVPGFIHTIIPAGSVPTGGIPLTAPGQDVTDSSGSVYVADPGTNQVVRLDINSGALTMAAGGGSLSSTSADGGPATDALLNRPTAVALDAADNLYIAEAGANSVREVNLTTGVITTVAGNGTAGYSGDQGAATGAELNNPSGIAANATSDLFIADTGNNVIRKISALTGIITTVAGNGTVGFSGDGAAATSAELNAPQGVAIDAVGQIYIADTGNNIVRTVDSVTNVITTVAGNRTAGFSGDGAAATSASLNLPAAVALDAADNLYIADTNNARIRKVYSQSGIIVTVAGSVAVGDQGDGKSATAAALSQPSGVALDSLGQILISDQSNGSVRQVSTDTPILNFGSETVGVTTAAQTDYLSNIGNQSLVISQFSAPLDFPMNTSDAAQCTVGNLVAGSLCDLSFAFHPTVSGPLTEDALLTDNALNAMNAQQAVTMTGNGVAPILVATTTTVSVNPTTAIYGTPVTLTATVITGTGPVTNGSVVFSINGVEVIGASLNGSGVATATILAAPTGTDVVTASFAAQGDDDASSSNQATLTVAPAGSQVVLTASTQSIRLGQNVIFTANVTSATTGIPTGNVIFMNGSAQIGETIMNATGQAIFNTQNLPAGADTITAQYQGDANFQPSTSNSIVVTVADDTLTMTVNPTQMSIPGGQTGQATVTLTPKNGFAGDVSLSCAGLIQGATCQFSSSTVTFVAQTQTPQTVTLTINPNTVATSGFAFPSGSKGGRLMHLLLLMLTLGAAFLLFRARRRSFLLGLGRALLVVFCIIGLTTLSGCSNLAPAQPVADPITVQASMPSTGVITSQQVQVYMAQ